MDYGNENTPYHMIDPFMQHYLDTLEGEVFLPIPPKGSRNPPKRVPGPEIMKLMSHINTGPSGNNLMSSADPSLTLFFKHEFDANERLKSYYFQKWPVESLDPKDMAEAGFFYLLNGDRVQCPFCEVVIDNWTPGQDPLLRHQAVNPHCDFIKGYDVQNIPISDDPVRGTNRRLISYDVAGFGPAVTLRLNGSLPQAINTNRQSLMDQHPEDLTPPEVVGSVNHQLNIRNRTGPSYPCYGSAALRLRTFQCPIWPASCPVKPEQLADAGFFFSG